MIRLSQRQEQRRCQRSLKRAKATVPPLCRKDCQYVLIDQDGVALIEGHEPHVVCAMMNHAKRDAICHFVIARGMRDRKNVRGVEKPKLNSAQSALVAISGEYYFAKSPVAERPKCR